MNNLSIDDQDSISDIKVDENCVYYGHSLCANCIVRYVGEIQSKQGVYFGIEFESPIGMNDGSVDGIAYFKCEPKHGLFVKNYRLKRIEDCPAPMGGIWSKLMKGIDVGNRVVVNGGLEGIVVTIFYWFSEERRANKPVMVGVLLDKRKGNSDGMYQGVRHFYCENSRATFVENFDVRLSTSRATIGLGETKGLSRANSIRSINSNTSEWRNPTPYFANNRANRSPALSSRDRPGLKGQLNLRNPSIAFRPSINYEDSSDKREIASLKNIIDELTKEQSKAETELQRQGQEINTKSDEINKLETELQTLKAEFEGVNFEILECRSIINSLGIGNVPEAGNAHDQAIPNVFVRTSRVLALLCLQLSRASPEEKERLTELFNLFFTVPHSVNIGSLPSTISAFEKALDTAEQIIPTMTDKFRPPAPSPKSDLILKVPSEQSTNISNTDDQNSSLSSFLESLKLESPLR